MSQFFRPLLSGLAAFCMVLPGAIAEDVPPVDLPEQAAHGIAQAAEQGGGPPAHVRERRLAARANRQRARERRAAAQTQREGQPAKVERNQEAEGGGPPAHAQERRARR